MEKKHRVAILGSGNFGSAICQIVGENVLRHPHQFEPVVKVWVFEEKVGDRKLTEVINTDHENSKYLPGHKFPPTVQACSDPVEVVRGATLLVFVLPHQFAATLCQKIRDHISAGARAISLLKGMSVSEDGRSPVLLSSFLSQALSVHAPLDVSCLSGANIAEEVARGPLSEATIGCHAPAIGELWKQVFDCPRYRVSVSPDVAGVELCGALKNIVALAAGICDGLKTGGNTKAAIIRIGFREMMNFTAQFFKGVEPGTFFESCGIADLIVTCFSGRHRKVAAAHSETGKPFSQLEAEMLNGQKLQGTHTAQEVHQILSANRLADAFPLFTAVYRIVFEEASPVTLFSIDLPHLSFIRSKL